MAVADICEHVNEALGTMKVGEFLNQLSGYHEHHKKGTAAWM